MSTNGFLKTPSASAPTVRRRALLAAGAGAALAVPRRVRAQADGPQGTIRFAAAGHQRLLDLFMVSTRRQGRRALDAHHYGERHRGGVSEEKRLM